MKKEKEVKEIKREELKEKVLKARTVLNVCLTVFSVITFPIYMLDYIVTWIYMTCSMDDEHVVRGRLYGLLWYCIAHRIRMHYVKKYGIEHCGGISRLLVYGDT